MLKRSWIVLLILTLLMPVALAQDTDKPSAMALWVSQSGDGRMFPAILDVLQSYGFIDESERSASDEIGDFLGENIDLYLRQIEGEATDVNSLVEIALDMEVDALITLGEPATQAALNLTLDMDDPPAVIFSRTTNPYAAGIADAPCLKPDHVTGLQTVVPYEEILALLQLQDPDLSVIGTIHTSSDAGGIYGAQRIAAIADEMGIRVESSAITALADLRLAIQGLVSKNIEAIVMPIDVLSASGTPIIAAAAIENGLPFFYASPGAIMAGATIGGGTLLYFDEIAYVGILLAAYLNGEMDIARTGIYQISNMAVGVNLDIAAMQGVEVAEQLVEDAAFVVEDGNLSLAGAGAMQMGRLFAGVVPLELRQANDMALLASLQCTDDMIAEQQAALDAAGE